MRDRNYLTGVIIILVVLYNTPKNDFKWVYSIIDSIQQGFIS